MEWMLLPLKRYADFSGRSRRKEYWMFVLGYIIAGAIIGLLYAMVGGMSESPSGAALAVLGIGVILGLAIIVPSIAVQVRRFHDQDKSGWMILLGLIPYVGGIIVLVFMCLDGTRGPNRFGPDPKGENLGDVFA